MQAEIDAFLAAGLFENFGSDYHQDVDNVVLNLTEPDGPIASSPVPLPASGLLLLGGLDALAWRRKRP